MRMFARAMIIFGLALLCSCAAHRSHSTVVPTPELPAEQVLGEKAGAEDLLVVTLRFSDGQTVPCVVDTGNGRTILDQSLNVPLGPRLQTDQITFPFGTNGVEAPGVYAAPKLYLGDTALMTDPTIFVGRVFDSNNCPYKAILGIDCLRHYCVQIDFDEHRLRFLDPNRLKREELGVAFPLSFPTNHGGMPVVEIKCATNRNVRLMVDTGFKSIDFSLPPDVAGPARQSHSAVDTYTYWNFQNSQIEVFQFPKVVIGREIYENVRFVQGEIAEKEWIEGIMGLPFLARHEVTFDFPNKTMYLRLRRSKTAE